MMGKKQSGWQCYYIIWKRKPEGFRSISKETGHKWFKCSQRVCSIYRETGHDPHKCPKMKNEDANLAISDQAGLVADADAFVSVSQEEHEFRLVVRGERRG